MKVGDYVRTKDYGIHKITNFVVFDDIEYIVDNNSMYYTKIDKREIIKSSPNIIDLIEVGDYVNGSKVLDILIDDKEKYLILETTEYSPNLSNDYIIELVNLSCDEKDIKSIVTKEQFERCEYKL